MLHTARRGVLVARDVTSCVSRPASAGGLECDRRGRCCWRARTHAAGMRHSSAVWGAAAAALLSKYPASWRSGVPGDRLPLAC